MKTASEIKQELSRMMREIKKLTYETECLPAVGGKVTNNLLDAVSDLREAFCTVESIVVPTA